MVHEDVHSCVDHLPDEAAFTLEVNIVRTLGSALEQACQIWATFESIVSSKI